MKHIEGENFDKYIEGIVGKYQFNVGIERNKPHYAAMRKLIGYKDGQPIYEKSWYDYAGIKLLRQGNRTDGTLYKVAKEMDEAFKWLRKPFNSKKNRDVLSVINFIVDNLNGRDNRQRILNALQAVVRNPILRGDYGRNSRKTAKEKGFDKLMMRTGQFFKNIKAWWA